jgi:predicted CopG family antitoxin
MNKTIYIKDDTYNELKLHLKTRKISFSQLVSRALNSYLNKERLNDWPKDFFKFNNSYKDIFPDAKELREGLIEPKD